MVETWETLMGKVRTMGDFVDSIKVKDELGNQKDYLVESYDDFKEEVEKANKSGVFSGDIRSNLNKAVSKLNNIKRHAKEIVRIYNDANAERILSVANTIRLRETFVRNQNFPETL
jgi:hypothetical protein